MAIDDLDPSALLSPLRTGLKLVRVLQRWREGPDRGAVYRDHYEEWVANLAAALREHAGDVEALAERLDALEQDRERVLVLGNYGLEALREAVDRRRAMLGDAALAAFVSDLGTAELARVERTIRMLDPEDLDLLCAVAELSSMHPFVAGARERWARLCAGHLGGAPLLASGCVVVSPFATTANITVDGGPMQDPRSMGADVSPLGSLVLRFMGRQP